MPDADAVTATASRAATPIPVDRRHRGRCGRAEREVSRAGMAEPPGCGTEPVDGTADVTAVTSGAGVTTGWRPATMPAVTSETPWRLLALAPLDLELWRALFGDLPLDVVVPAERTQAAAAAALGDAEIVVGDWTGALRVTGDEVAAAPRLAFVQQPSVGVDTLDTDALAAAGVPAANAAGVNAVSVAEWCVGASYAVLRWLAWADASMRAGDWPQLEGAQRGGREVAGRRVGIVGMGTIGVECARRFVALGADVAHWSRTERPADRAGGARWLPLDDLLAHSQLLVLVVALAPETAGLLSAERLALLPAGAYVVNAARGGVLDEQALLAAVRSGALAGAALAVYASEPLPA